MKPQFLSLTAAVILLTACATPSYNHEGLQATQAMTDMDGKPIAPQGGAANLGIGFGGGWHRGGFGVGFGTGW